MSEALSPSEAEAAARSGEFDRGARRSRRRRTALLVTLVVVVALYLVGGFVGVPWAAKRWIVPAIDDALAGSLRVDAISCNPLTFTVDIGPGELLDPSGERVLAFEQVRANFDPLTSLSTTSWHFHEVNVTSPALDVELDEQGTMNLVRALAPTSPSPPTDSEDPLLRRIPHLRVAHGAVRNASLHVTDRSRERPFEAEWSGADFTFDDLDLAPLRRSEHRLTASSSDGAKLEWEGSLVTEPASARGTFRLTGFNVAPIMPYLTAATTAELVGGTLDATLEYELAPTDEPPVARLMLHDASIDDLRLLDPTMDQTIPLLDASRVRVVDAHIDLVRRSISVRSLRTSGGELHVGRDQDGQPAILRLFPIIAAEAAVLVPEEGAPGPAGAATPSGAPGASDPPTAPGPSPAQSPARASASEPPAYPVERVAAALTLLLRRATEGWDVVLESVALHGHTLRYTDRSTRRVIELRLDDTELTAGPIRSSEAFAAPFDLRGRMRGGTSMTASAPRASAASAGASDASARAANAAAEESAAVQAATAPDSGRLELRGVLRPLETGVDVDIDADSIPLTPIAPYLPHRPVPELGTMELTSGTATVQGHAKAIVLWATREMSVDWDGFSGLRTLRMTLDGVAVPLAALDAVEAKGKFGAKLASSRAEVQWNGAAGFEQVSIDAPIQPATVKLAAGAGHAEGALDLQLREGEGLALKWTGKSEADALAASLGATRAGDMPAASVGALRAADAPAEGDAMPPGTASLGAKSIRYDGWIEGGTGTIIEGSGGGALVRTEGVLEVAEAALRAGMDSGSNTAALEAAQTQFDASLRISPESTSARWDGTLTARGLGAEHADPGAERRATLATREIRYAGKLATGFAPAGDTTAETNGALTLEGVELEASTPPTGAIDFGASALEYLGEAKTVGRRGVDPRLSFHGAVVGREMRVDAPAFDDAKLSVREWHAYDAEGDSQERRAAIRELTVSGAIAELSRVLIPPAEDPAATETATADRDADATQGDAASAAAPAAVTAAPALPDLSIVTIRLDDASLIVHDTATEPPARLTVSDVRAEINSLSTHGDQPATVAIEGLVQEAGRFDLRGTLHPLEPARNTELELKLTTLPLKPYDPYAHRFVGYEIDSGRATLGLPVTVHDFNLQGELDATLDRFYLGDARPSPEAPDLPIKLGLDLLRDGNERIAVNVPFSGDMRDPSFELSGVIWQAIVNLLVKATTAPFTLLGALVGAGDRDLSMVEFEPGSSELTADRLADLDLLAKALAERPAISVRAIGTVSEAADVDGLRSAALRERLRRDAGVRDGAEFPQRDYEDALKRAYRRLPRDARDAAEREAGGSDASTETMERVLAAAIEIDAVALEALALARAEAVVRALVEQGGVDVSRVSAAVAADAPDGPPRVTFELQ